MHYVYESVVTSFYSVERYIVRLDAHPLQLLTYVICVIGACGCYVVNVQSIVEGSLVFAYVVPVFVSIVLLCRLSRLCDHKRFWGFEFLDLRHQSWAYVFGDAFLIPSAFVAMSIIWQDRVDQVPDWVKQPWWFAVTATATIVLSIVLYKVDKIRYKKEEALPVLNNPGKVAHTLLVVPMLMGPLLTAGIPVLLVEWDVWTFVVVVNVTLWFVLVAVDDKLRFVNPHWQYGFWDPERFKPQPIEQTIAMTRRSLGMSGK